MSDGIEAIAFDKDGVIFDSESIYHHTLLQTLSHYEIPLGATFAEQFRGLAAPKTFAILSQAIEKYVDVDEFIAKWLGKKDDVLDHSGLPLIDGTKDMIQALYDQGYPLALVTSDSHENVLQDFSLTDPQLLSCFSVIITLDDVNEAKPAPEPYQRAAALLGVESDRLLVIEDSDLGARAAVDSGANVLLYRPKGEVDGLLKQQLLNVINHPSQLMDYLS